MSTPASIRDVATSRTGWDSSFSRSARSASTAAAVARAHQRRQMGGAGQLPDRLKQRARMGAAVDDAQHPRLLGEACGDRRHPVTGSVKIARLSPA